jgi:lipid-A-disaccharide synthase
VTTILIVAGEASGDLHGSNLARSLRELDPSIRIIGAGGPRMREAGVEILFDPTAHAAVGAIEAFHSMNEYLRLFRGLQSALKRHRPDAAVLIDFPDFNLRFAERVRDHGVPVIYYISPQIWAWRRKRIRIIQKLVRKMIVIFEFEEEIYRNAGVDVAFVGHPLLDVIGDPPDTASLRKEWGAGDGRTLIGLLPGSRSKQFQKLFPRMKKAAARIADELPETRFVVACAPHIDPARAESPHPVARDRAHDVMAASDLLLTASGTATIEAAILGTPMIVTYVLSLLTAFTLAPLVKLDHYAMVNIVAGRRIMPELYQFKGSPASLAREAVAILREGRLPTMKEELAKVRKKLGEPGASMRAAREVLRTLS